ncbi:uncharacterized protein LOC143200222 [Rhynchophorus ferrugineus]|uniref:Osiris 16 n=1 Tax=Rhynchophorus ferrugineus TaxID=354439 RepID=A0A834IKU4_RHYFE|nr:hypothetical protein GWI33_007069 [Rhynchophorus ferrugineus]
MDARFTAIVVSALMALVIAGDVRTNTVERSDFKKSFGKNCDDSYSLTCLKLNVATWVDRLSDDDSFDVIPGVSIVRENSSVQETSSDIAAELAREFPDDPNARLDGFLLKKVSGFFDNHAIKLNFWNAAQADAAVTARKKDKKGDGGMGMLLAAGAMMKGTLMALAMGGLAALAGKALMTGLIALVLSAISALKGLSGGGGHSTYEVIAKPVYTSSHSHSTSHEGWDGGNYGHKRSLDQVPLPLGLHPEYTPK